MRGPFQHGIIIGGGIAGPLLAIFLKRIGTSSVVYEAQEQRAESTAGLQIAPNGMHVLAALGLADEVRRQGMVASHFHFRNHKGKTLALVRNGDASVYGQPSVMLSRSLLHRIVTEAAARAGIRIEYGKTFRRLYPDIGVTAEFEDGSSTHGDFLIGADGLHSRVREFIALDSRPQHTGLIGLGGFVPRSAFRSHIEPDESALTMTFGPGGFFGYGTAALLRAL